MRLRPVLLPLAVFVVAACASGKQTGTNSTTSALTPHAATSTLVPAGTVTEFPLPTPYSSPNSIAAGRDGHMWFTDGKNNEVAKITIAGVITEYPVPTPQSEPGSIAAGPDGNMWFTEANSHKVAKVTPAGVITEYPVPATPFGPGSIAAGPDGNMWFTEAQTSCPSVPLNIPGEVARITPSGAITEYRLPAAPFEPGPIAAGPDGNMWFTEHSEEWCYSLSSNAPDKIAKITPSGDIIEYPLDVSLAGFGRPAVGPDGDLWFTEASRSRVAKISSGEMVAEYQIFSVCPPDSWGNNNCEPLAIARGPDGNMWFTERRGARVARITPAGAISDFALPADKASAPASPGDIALGPDGSMWFTDGNRLAKITTQATTTAQPVTLTELPRV